MARVHSLHHVTLAVPDLAAAARFYAEQWGMARVGSEGDELLFRSRRSPQPDLRLKAGSHAPLAEIAFAVKSKAHLEEIRRALDAAGYSSFAESERIVTKDGDGNRVVVLHASQNAAIPPESEKPGAFGPLKLGHVVLWTPDPRRSEGFYEVLGLKVTDRTQVGMSFMRCNTDHHTLAFVHSAAGRSGLQHVAFDVGSLDAVMRELGRLRRAGIECCWGPGRHGPGNNIFTYYLDPAGNIVEYYADMEQFPEDEAPARERFWQSTYGGDIWGVAGPAPEMFRR